jgi:hypothetical protein
VTGDYLTAKLTDIGLFDRHGEDRSARRGSASHQLSLLS